MEVTKALAALQPLYGKDNVEIVTVDGQRVRGVVRSMKTTQALTTPSVKIECANGEIVKIPFPSIAEIKDHNGAATASSRAVRSQVRLPLVVPRPHMCHCFFQRPSRIVRRFSFQLMTKLECFGSFRSCH